MGKKVFEELIKRTEQLEYDNSTELDFIKRKAEMNIRRELGEDSYYLDELNSIRYRNAFANIYTKGNLWEQGKNQLINMFKTIIEEEEIYGTSKPKTNSLVHKSSQTNNIFVVHGHDEAMKNDVARTIGRLDLEPIILHEQPNKGRTIIEKFTDYANVGFAVVLLSPDDVAYSKKDSAKKTKFRARQNVIFELGFFIGKLGREQVLPLYRVDDEFEMPSDYSGILFTPYDEGNNWKLNLVRELQTCGYDVDANKIL